MNTKRLKEIEKAFSLYSTKVKQPDIVPENWFTTQQYAYEADVNVSTANKQIGKLINSGFLKSKKYLVECPDKVCRWVPHYTTSKNSDLK